MGNSNTLLLLRHGKSNWKLGLDDFDRPLKKRGRVDVESIGRWLVGQGLVPDYIVCSAAVRTRETADICCNAMGVNAGSVVIRQNLYLAGLGDLLNVIANIPAKKSQVLLIGHNPGLEMLFRYIVKKVPPRHEDGKLLPTGTLAQIALGGDFTEIAQASGKLLNVVRGKELT